MIRIGMSKNWVKYILGRRNSTSGIIQCDLAAYLIEERSSGTPILTTRTAKVFNYLLTGWRLVIVWFASKAPSVRPVGEKWDENGFQRVVIRSRRKPKNDNNRLIAVWRFFNFRTCERVSVLPPFFQSENCSGRAPTNCARYSSVKAKCSCNQPMWNRASSPYTSGIMRSSLLN